MGFEQPLLSFFSYLYNNKNYLTLPGIEVEAAGLVLRECCFCAKLPHLLSHTISLFQSPLVPKREKYHRAHLSLIPFWVKNSCHKIAFFNNCWVFPQLDRVFAAMMLLLLHELAHKVIALNKYELLVFHSQLANIMSE